MDAKPPAKQTQEGKGSSQAPDSILGKTQGLFGPGSFFSDDIKTAVVAGLVETSILSGDDNYLQSASPDTKRLKEGMSSQPTQRSLQSQQGQELETVTANKPALKECTCQSTYDLLHTPRNTSD